MENLWTIFTELSQGCSTSNKQTNKPNPWTPVLLRKLMFPWYHSLYYINYSFKPLNDSCCPKEIEEAQW